MTDIIDTDDSNVIDINFEKNRMQNDVDAFKSTGKLPDTLTTRKFLIKHNSIYECILNWSHALNLVGDPVWSEIIDAYIEYARGIEIAAATDIFLQLEKETKLFLKEMGCRVFKFLTPTIKGDAEYKSHIFSLGRDLEFIVPKIRYGIELTSLEKFKVSLYVAQQRAILDNINDDLKKINDLIIRYKPYSFITWSEAMQQCLKLRSQLDHTLLAYISAGSAINSVLPYTIK